MSDSVWPHRQQPTRLLCPWDSPGKNTGVGCHFLPQSMKVKSENEVTQSRPHWLQPTKPLHPWDFPGESTGVGCHCLLRCLLLGNCLYLWNLPSEEASFSTCICFGRVLIWGLSWCFWSQYCFSLILLTFQHSWPVVPQVCLVNPWEALETF